jgi:hypothetical protein
MCEGKERIKMDRERERKMWGRRSSKKEESRRKERRRGERESEERKSEERRGLNDLPH